MRRRPGLVLVTTLLAAGGSALLAAPGSARAHGGGAVPLRPVLDAPPPALAGMQVELRETLGWQLVLANPTSRPVEVLDERGRAFLRIGPGGVLGDVAAPAWYRTLGPDGAVPASLAADAAPRWRQASREPSYGWFDPRVAAPDAHRPAAPDAHRPAAPGAYGPRAAAERFEVPLRVAGERVALSGRFRREPDASGRFRARLTSPSEPTPGLRVTLLPGRAPGLLVRNATGRALLVFGRHAEPFLRITPEGVDANLRSPTWRASARSASGTLPSVPAAEAGAVPAWQRVSGVPRFAWIDPRALVMDAPAAGDSVAPSAWTVPMQLGDEALRVTGVVSWSPRGDTGSAASP
jgi:hypothetical protein